MQKAKQAWAVRALPCGEPHMVEFLKWDLVALGLPDLGSVAGKDFEIRVALLRACSTMNNRDLGSSAGALDMLANRMSAGDYVLVPSPEDGEVYIGEVRGSYRHATAKEEAKYSHQRRVRWLMGKTSIPRAALPLPVIKSLKAHQRIFSIDVGAVDKLVLGGSSKSKAEGWFGEADTDGVIHAYEGELMQALSWRATRNRQLRNDKVRHALKANGGRLICEVPNCHFDFQKVYGTLGKGFAHVHHRVGFAVCKGPRPVSRDDLAIVCANCHAMLHRGGKCRRLDELIPDRRVRPTPEPNVWKSRRGALDRGNSQ